MSKNKKWWKKLLDAIAAQNKEVYGEGGMHCCDVRKATLKENNK